MFVTPKKNLDVTQTRFLQPLRSNTIHSTVTAAIEDILAIQSSLHGTIHSDGISVIARYWESYDTETKTGSNAKSVLGIYSQTTDSFTFFVHDVDAIDAIIDRVKSLETKVGDKSVSEQIIAAIENLDSTASAKGELIKFSVGQVDGKLTGATIDESALKTRLAGIEDKITGLEGNLGEGGSVTTQITTAINALKSDVTSTNGSYVNITVNQAEGKLTAASVNETKLAEKFAEINTSIGKAVSDAKTELIGDATEGYSTLGDLEDKIKAVESAAKSYSIVAITEGLSENVRDAWKLVDEDNVQVGPTIQTYKDSSLISAYLGSETDTVDVNTGAVTKNEATDAQSLNFVYQLSNGKYEIVKVDVSKFLSESEFGDGLQVNNGVVSIKINETSEDEDKFLKVGENGIYTEGINEAISKAIASEAKLREDADKSLDERLDALVSGDNSVSKQITNAINGLDSTVTKNTDNISLEVVQTDGKLASITLTQTDIASATALTKEVSDRQAADKALGERIDNLNLEDAAIEGQYVSKVTQTKGQISVERVALPTVSEVKSEGQAIVSVKQDAGKVTAVVGDVAAAHVTVADGSGLFKAENVEGVLTEIDTAYKAADEALGKRIDDVKNSAISVIQGNGINITEDADDTTIKTITAKVKDGDTLLEVTKDGIGLQLGGYIDSGTF